MTALPLPLFDDPARPAPSIKLPARQPEGLRPRAAGVSSLENSPGASRSGVFSEKEITKRLRARISALLGSGRHTYVEVASVLIAGGWVTIDPDYPPIGRWPGITVHLPRQCYRCNSCPAEVAKMCGEAL